MSNLLSIDALLGGDRTLEAKVCDNCGRVYSVKSSSEDLCEECDSRTFNTDHNEEAD